MGGNAEEKEKQQFVSPTRAVFVQTGPNNVLTVQVAHKLAGESVGRQMFPICCHQLLRLFCVHHPSSLLTSLSFPLDLPYSTHTHTHTHTHTLRITWRAAAQINATFPVWGELIRHLKTHETWESAPRCRPMGAIGNKKPGSGVVSCDWPRLTEDI